MINRLTELLEGVLDPDLMGETITQIAEHLIENGVIVPPVALECCSGAVDDVLKVDCDKCPYDIGSAECKGLERDALAVIKELREERKDFEIRALRAENEATKYKDRYETAKQAHEMLSESYDHLEKTKDELLSERSRLTEENAKIGIENFNLICELSRIKEGIVRSMQQRLKEAVCNNTYPDVNKEGKPINVWKAKTGYATIDQIASGVIDQITKEMTARSVAKSITEEEKND